MTGMPRLGKLELDAPFFQAGLAGYSDTAMRLVARRHGCPYCVTEALLDMFLIQGGRGLKMAELHELDHPIAGQLMGSHPADIARGAKVLLGMGYDVIDVNLACPVKKIKKKSRGGHLMSVPDEAIATLDAVKQAVGDAAPCTVKLRRGSDDSPEALKNFHTIFQAVIDLGYAGAVVHGRSVKQKYIGPSNWDFLRSLTDQYGHVNGFTIGGSGDVWQAADIFKMLEYTKVHWVSVARGCIGNPWVFKQARAIMAGDLNEASRPPTIFEQRNVLMQHFELSIAAHGEQLASKLMRKFSIRFSRHHPQGEAVRKAFINVMGLPSWRAVLQRYYDEDGPGVGGDEALPEEALWATASAMDGCGM